MKGVTLIELVVTIAVLGILAGITATVLVPAYEAYFASQRRADLADVADTALRRMMRDIRLALPNTPRVKIDGANQFVEFLLTKNGGRYRAVHDNDNPVATGEVPLRFDNFVMDFDTLGTLSAAGEQQVQPNDYVVIHNLGIAGADAYDVGAANPNIAQIASIGPGAIAGEDRITLAAATRFALESPGRRFFVVAGPVTYACIGGQLLRWSGYAIQATHGALGTNEAPRARPAGAAEAVLADSVSACEFTYTNQLPQQSRGMVTVRLAITRAGETVVLYQQAHVNNVP